MKKFQKIVKAYGIDKVHLRITVYCLMALIISQFFCLYLEKIEDTNQIETIVEYTYEKFNDNSERIHQDSNSYEISDFIRIENVALIIKEFCMIITSILISSIFTMFIVEKKHKNEIYTSAVYDFFDETHCKVDVSDLQKTNVEIYKQLNEKCIPNDLVEHVLTKICYAKEPFYYTKYEVTVNCTIKSNCIEKVILETINLRSYSDSYKFDSVENPYNIAEMLYKSDKKIKLKKPLVINKFQVGNAGESADDIDIKDINLIKRNYKNNVDRQFGYNKLLSAQSPVDIEISNAEDTQISISYTTYVPLSDKIFTFRIPCACKEFKFDFRLNDDYGMYRINGNAFGFFDTANGTVNEDNNHHLTFRFNDWSFKENGVVVNITE